MSGAVQEILARIDQLDEAEQEELHHALQVRSRAQWEQLAAIERRRSADEGISEEDVDRAVDEIRHVKKTA
jgi:hypothetical protein